MRTMRFVPTTIQHRQCELHLRCWMVHRQCELHRQCERCWMVVEHYDEQSAPFADGFSKSTVSAAHQTTNHFKSTVSAAHRRIRSFQIHRGTAAHQRIRSFQIHRERGAPDDESLQIHRECGAPDDESFQIHRECGAPDDESFQIHRERGAPDDESAATKLHAYRDPEPEFSPLSVEFLKPQGSHQTGHDGGSHRGQDVPDPHAVHVAPVEVEEESQTPHGAAEERGPEPRQRGEPLFFASCCAVVCLGVVRGAE